MIHERSAQHSISHAELTRAHTQPNHGRLRGTQQNATGEEGGADQSSEVSPSAWGFVSPDPSQVPLGLLQQRLYFVPDP